jgi:hypothetical protein
VGCFLGDEVVNDGAVSGVMNKGGIFYAATEGIDDSPVE